MNFVDQFSIVCKSIKLVLGTIPGQKVKVANDNGLMGRLTLDSGGMKKMTT